jgi:hypothetical protein
MFEPVNNTIMNKSKQQSTPESEFFTRNAKTIYYLCDLGWNDDHMRRLKILARLPNEHNPDKLLQLFFKMAQEGYKLKSVNKSATGEVRFCLVTDDGDKQYTQILKTNKL